MDDIEQFVAGYDEGHRQQIEFAWNGKHAGEFHDANQDFRSRVVSFVCENPGRGPVELLRDLFIEESKWSVQAWCAPFTFANLGALLLTHGGGEYLSDFLEGFSASFDTFGACHQMNLDPIVGASLLRDLEARLNQTNVERDTAQLESGKELLEKLQTGNASEGWAVLQPGTPVKNIRVIGRTALAWRRLKDATFRALKMR